MTKKRSTTVTLLSHNYGLSARVIDPRGFWLA